MALQQQAGNAISTLNHWKRSGSWGAVGVMGPMCHMVRVLLLLAFVQAAVADSILGCGGFVEVSITFPFKIEVHLRISGALIASSSYLLLFTLVLCLDIFEFHHVFGDEK